nr:MAG TPA: hypothetical protein [Microviridae sp.]
MRRTSFAAWCEACRAEVLSSDVACEVAKTDERRHCAALSRGVSEPARSGSPVERRSLRSSEDGRTPTLRRT